MSFQSEGIFRQLGDRVVGCDLHCEGIRNSREAGIIPRMLVKEPRYGTDSRAVVGPDPGRSKRISCAVVGLNPGKSKPDEREFYINNGSSLSSVQDYFFQKTFNIPYFKRTRELVTSLGFSGDILWTELVKCESDGMNGRLPIQTKRVCINRFLKEEIKAFEPEAIFALGNDAFQACALIFPDNFVVGVPHPTGSHGDFAKLKKAIGANSEFFKNMICRKVDSNSNCLAIWLGFQAEVKPG